MGRTYAGILGPLTFLTVVLRGAIEGRGAEGTLLTASLLMFAFAGLGYVLGRVAALIVDDSVQAEFRAELETLKVTVADDTPPKR
ncbi:MAG: hypothetical protein RIC55_34425 [Pirellulaceae bacterium]